MVSPLPLVLVVDDDPAITAMVGELLEMEGYETLLASSGVEAIVLARARRPALIVLDVMMPGLGGYAVAMALRGHLETSIIPIIFVSAMNDTDHRLKALSIGADDYMGKPFDCDELVARIAAVLRRRPPDDAPTPPSGF